MLTKQTKIHSIPVLYSIMSVRFRQAFHDTFVKTLCPSKTPIFGQRARSMSTMYNSNVYAYQKAGACSQKSCSVKQAPFGDQVPTPTSVTSPECRPPPSTANRITFNSTSTIIPSPNQEGKTILNHAHPPLRAHRLDLMTTRQFSEPVIFEYPDTSTGSGEPPSLEVNSKSADEAEENPSPASLPATVKLNPILKHSSTSRQTTPMANGTT